MNSCIMTHTHVCARDPTLPYALPLCRFRAWPGRLPWGLRTPFEAKNRRVACSAPPRAASSPNSCTRFARKCATEEIHAPEAHVRVWRYHVHTWRCFRVRRCQREPQHGCSVCLVHCGRREARLVSRPALTHITHPPYPSALPWLPRSLHGPNRTVRTTHDPPMLQRQ